MVDRNRFQCRARLEKEKCLRNGFEKSNFGSWDFHLTTWSGSALQNVTGTLPTGGDGYTLWVGREVKTEIPDKTLSVRRPRERVCVAGPFSSSLEVCNAFGF
jgi:hypothetical protein